MKVKSESEVAQVVPSLSDPTDCSLPGSSVHGVFQAKTLEWVAIAFSKKTTLVVTKGEKERSRGKIEVGDEETVYYALNR